MGATQSFLLVLAGRSVSDDSRDDTIRRPPSGVLTGVKEVITCRDDEHHSEVALAGDSHGRPRLRASEQLAGLASTSHSDASRYTVPLVRPTAIDQPLALEPKHHILTPGEYANSSTVTSSSIETTTC
jgi:hypothetical protein